MGPTAERAHLSPPFRRALLSALLPLVVLNPAAAPAAALEPPEPDGLSPEEERSTFRLEPGFRIELVAAEPRVADPVAVAWDERGRLWVAEMPGYPVGPEGGRVRVLEDRDRDGSYESGGLFAEGLPLASTSVLPFRGGVLVSAAPHILLLRDADGDGRAEAPLALHTGFHEGNSQLRVNGLLLGPDLRVWGANGRSGGKVRRLHDPPGDALDLSSFDFRFDFETLRLERTGGPSQFGHAFDAWGRRFLSWNTVHLRQEILLPADLERHPRLLRTACAASISDHGDAARVHPLAPPPRTFNNEPTDHFNASCGIAVEAGGLFPPPYAGSAFVCEPLSGLVHRDRLAPGAGPALVASRGEEGREFLASTDPWFHPVNVRSGPDGALYVVDFYRELVEHPEYVPAKLRGAIEFRRGAGRGRLWRILPEGSPPLAVEDLSVLEPGELARRLESPSGEVRGQAQRLLLERRDPAALEPLFTLAARSPVPLARAAALRLLGALGALHPRSLEPALEDGEPRLRECALRIAREVPARLHALAPHLLRLARDADAAVRFQAVLALGDLRGPRGDQLQTAREEEVVEALARAAIQDGGDAWFQSAVLSGLHRREARFLERLLEGGGGGREEVLSEAAELAGAVGAEEAADKVLALASSSLGRGSARAAFLLAEALGRGRKRGGAAPLAGAGGGKDLRANLLEEAARRARDGLEAPRVRSAAAALLGQASWELSGKVLPALLDPREDPEVQRAAARALAAQDPAEAPAALLGAWSRSTPGVRRLLLEGLVSRREGAAALLEALERGEVPPRDLELPGRESLRRALPEGARPRLEALLRPAPVSRQEVLERYGRETPLSGDAERGRRVFAAACAPCHRFRGEGHGVGPELAGAGKKSRETLLEALLDPGRSVVPGFTVYTALTSTGEVRTGIIASETATSLTLRRAGGEEDQIPRSAIISLSSTAATLMPEGLEATLTPQDMADLLEHLRGEE